MQQFLHVSQHRPNDSTTLRALAAVKRQLERGDGDHKRVWPLLTPWAHPENWTGSGLLRGFARDIRLLSKPITSSWNLGCNLADAGLNGGQ